MRWRGFATVLVWAKGEEALPTPPSIDGLVLLEVFSSSILMGPRVLNLFKIMGALILACLPPGTLPKTAGSTCIEALEKVWTNGFSV